MRVCIYYRQPDPNRWFPGDRHLRAFVRRLVRGEPRVGGIGRVVVNLREGLRRIGVDSVLNLPFSDLGPDDHVAAFGIGRDVLKGYDRTNPIVGAIALMNRPQEWPTLFDDYPVATYLQHSEWAADLYRPYFGERCGVWPVGIDTDQWKPDGRTKTNDFLVYVKTDEVESTLATALLERVRASLTAQSLRFSEIRYGGYREGDYRAALMDARGMIFLSPHESQGLACEEALACDVPVLAWNPGVTVERPAGFAPTVSTSVPYFDERCGVRFAGARDFDGALAKFVERRSAGAFEPRDYVIETLTLEKAARHFCEILLAARR